MKFTPEFLKIAVLRADGGTSVMSFCTLGRGDRLTEGAVWAGIGIWRRPATDAAIAAEVARTNFGSPAVSWQRITEGAAMHDDLTVRDYRGALICEGGKLRHDIARARESHRNLLRAERNAKLLELDGQWMRAVGRKNKADEDRIEAERQKWRDAPADPRIEAARTVEELKQVKVG